MNLRRARGIQLDRHRREHRLRANSTVAEFAAQLFECNALVRRVLIDQEQPLLGLERDVPREDLSDHPEFRVHRDWRRWMRRHRRVAAARIAIVGEAERALKRRLIGRIGHQPQRRVAARIRNRIAGGGGRLARASIVAHRRRRDESHRGVIGGRRRRFGGRRRRVN